MFGRRGRLEANVAADEILQERGVGREELGGCDRLRSRAVLIDDVDAAFVEGDLADCVVFDLLQEFGEGDRGSRGARLAR